MTEEENTAEQAARPDGEAPPWPDRLVPVVDGLRAHFPDLQPQLKMGDWLEVGLPPEQLLGVGRYLRDELGIDYLSCVSGVDYPDRGVFQVVYHLMGVANQAKLVLKVEVPRDDPRVPSVTPLWTTADWHERETWDLMGIVFTDHPNLRRILLREDWVGHPLRKDYVDWRKERPRVKRETYDPKVEPRWS